MTYRGPPPLFSGDKLHHAVHGEALRPPRGPHGEGGAVGTLCVPGGRVGEEDAEGGRQVGQEQR